MQWKSLESVETYLDPEIRSLLAQYYLEPLNERTIPEIKSRIDCFFHNKLHQNNFICRFDDLQYEVSYHNHVINITAGNLTTMCIFLGEIPSFHPMDEPEVFVGAKFKIIYTNKKYFQVYPRPKISI